MSTYSSAGLQVRLTLANGSTTDFVRVDSLVEPSKDEEAAYDWQVRASRLATVCWPAHW
jgi:hypothetical protein